MKSGQPGDLSPVHCLQVRFPPSSHQKMEPEASPGVAGVSWGQRAGSVWERGQRPRGTGKGGRTAATGTALQRRMTLDEPCATLGPSGRPGALGLGGLLLED